MEDSSDTERLIAKDGYKQISFYGANSNDGYDGTPGKDTGTPRGTSQVDARTTRRTSPINDGTPRSTSPVNAGNSRATSPATAAASRGTSPATAAASRGTSPANNAASKGTSPANAAASRGTSPANAAASRGTSPVNAAASRGTSPVNAAASRGTSPVNTGNSRGTSPANTGTPSITSPANAGTFRGIISVTAGNSRSPVNVGSSRGTSPVNAGSSRDSSPLNAGSPRGTSPVNSGTPRNTTPVGAGTSRSNFGNAPSGNTITFRNTPPGTFRSHGNSPSGNVHTPGSASPVIPAATHEIDISESTEPSSSIMFNDISYQVTSKAHCKSLTKIILKEIYGIFKPGMNAIMGATGSGKTSFLDVLAMRKSPKGLRGTILLDGKRLPENFRLMVGYVAQDDKVTGTLTIRENLAFSAALRLPQSVSKRERRSKVEQVLHELGLTEVADTKVGNDFTRGVSGGERKRCSIGMELVISPPLLFLDEPTTGLDASTANAVMMLLRKLSLRGRNIIFSIHQPRFAIFRLFDSLMLLSHGSIVYHGPSKDAVDFFGSMGYICDQFNNPADFFLDVINGDSTAVKAHDMDTKDEESKEMSPALLNQHYLCSRWWNQIEQEIKPIIDNHHKGIAYRSQVPLQKVHYKTGFFSQLGTVSGRAVKNLYRNPRIFYSQFSVTIVFALLVGAIYFRLSHSGQSAIQNRTGAFFLIIMNQIFGNMSAVELFIKERAIFIHENIGGFYRTSTYFLAKVFCDVIPMRLFPALAFSAIAYYMIGLRGGIDHFAIFVVVGFFTSMASVGLAFFFSSTVKVYGIATLLLSLSYVFMMLFTGFLINVGDLGEWIGWLKYVSIFYYSLNTLNINELKGQIFCEGISNVDQNDYLNFQREGNETCYFGNAYLESQHVDYKTSWDLWKNVVALASLTVGFLCLAYIQLRRINKFK